MPTQESLGNTTRAPRGTPRPLDGPSLWVAVFAVAVWLIFSIFMLIVANGSSDVQWTRMAWVFGSVEAIAFAAAGALFGTSVQRDQTVQAEQRAQAAGQVAEQNREGAARGRALAAAMQADAGTSGDSALESMGPAAALNEDVRRRHAQLARSLFGDLIS